jgi:Sperm-tail PG-rich repeat
VKSDTVGPGEYEVIKPLGATKKGPSWHVSKNQNKKALTTSVTEGSVDIPGPGHYNAEKVDIFPIYKYKPSSVFVSKVARENGKNLRGAPGGLPPKPNS